MADEKVETVDLYDVNKGLGVSPLSYEAQISRLTEERRAVAEDREPDYDNPGSHVGTVYVTAGGLLRVLEQNAPDSLAVTQQAVVDALVESDENDLQVAVTLPVEAFEGGEPAEEEEVPAEEEETTSPETTASTPTSGTTSTTTASKTTSSGSSTSSSTS